MQIGCDRVRTQLSAFIDDELSAPEREEVAAHLETCPACRRECDSLVAILGDLKADLQAAAPGGAHPGDSGRDAGSGAGYDAGYDTTHETKYDTSYRKLVRRLGREAFLRSLGLISLALFYIFLLMELRHYLSPLVIRVLAAIAVVDILGIFLLFNPWLPGAAKLVRTGAGGSEGKFDTGEFIPLWITLGWSFGQMFLAMAWLRLLNGPTLVSRLLKTPASGMAILWPVVVTAMALIAAGLLARKPAPANAPGNVPRFLDGLPSNFSPLFPLFLFGFAEEFLFRGALQPTIGWFWALLGFSAEQYLLYERTSAFLLLVLVLGTGLAWIAQNAGVLPAVLGHIAFSALMIRRWRESHES